MDNQELFRYIDHTLLKPYATWEEIRTLCMEAIQYGTASVCIPPCYVKPVKDAFGDKVTICTVIGFPLGYQTAQTKAFEAKQAVAEGADEVDMVINITSVKNNSFTDVTEEIASIKEAVGAHILKVIIETCYLTAEEKIQLCKAVTHGGADYIKTSTGFGTDGAKLEDIRLFKEHLGAGVKIKAAGGVKSVCDLKEFIQAGCDRIGTSSAVKMIQGEQNKSTY